MLTTALLILAILGMIATLVGHVLLVRDSDTGRPVLSFILLCLIPVLNLIYLVRSYATARRGAFIAITGLWLTVPYAGLELWEKQDTVMRRIEQRKKEFTRRMHKADDTLDTASMSPEEIEAWSDERARRLVEKEKLVAQLNARLAWWFQQLQQRRAALAPADESALRSFNAEAAAYASLNVTAKEKTAELVAIRSVVKR